MRTVTGKLGIYAWRHGNEFVSYGRKQASTVLKRAIAVFKYLDILLSYGSTQKYCPHATSGGGTWSELASSVRLLRIQKLPRTVCY